MIRHDAATQKGRPAKVGGAPPMSRRVRDARRPRMSSLRVSEGFRSFVLDQLEELGDVVPRWMFGGVGLYRNGLFFGIVAGDVLYLKVDDTNRPDYARAAMPPFKPYRDRSGTMQYYAVPLDVLESVLELAAWARKAVTVAERAAAAKPEARVGSPAAKSGRNRTSARSVTPKPTFGRRKSSKADKGDR